MNFRFWIASAIRIDEFADCIIVIYLKETCIYSMKLPQIARQKTNFIGRNLQKTEFCSGKHFSRSAVFGSNFKF